jgi:hypothetical protein
VSNWTYRAPNDTPIRWIIYLTLSLCVIGYTRK